jgi:hypothetical protein
VRFSRTLPSVLRSTLRRTGTRNRSHQQPATPGRILYRLVWTPCSRHFLIFCGLTFSFSWP